MQTSKSVGTMCLFSSHAYELNPATSPPTGPPPHIPGPSLKFSLHPGAALGLTPRFPHCFPHSFVRFITSKNLFLV